MELFDPIERSQEIENIVMKDGARKYYRAGAQGVERAPVFRPKMNRAPHLR